MIIFFTWLFIFILASFNWLFSWRLLAGNGLPIFSLILFGCLVAGQALLLCHGVAILRLSPAWRFRLGFIVSFGFCLCLTLIPSLIPGKLSVWQGGGIFETISPRSSAIWITILIGWFGAFIGGLSATSLEEGLWENNCPPSQSDIAKVYALHQRYNAEPIRTPLLKRLFDILVSCLGLVISLPLWLLCLFIIWISDPGPILFVKNSVGKGGRNFRQLKLRTMLCGAEQETGPILAQEDDERVLVFGRLLRKTALDELPQLINILLGQMSVVGPRPQRTVLVLHYLEQMPEYAERHCVLPGLAGLAQVAGSYYLTPRQKLRFDRLYIRHQSLGFDLRLLLAAFLIAFWFRWQKDWNGRLPRRLLHIKK